VSLNRDLFDHVKILRYHLGQCDTLCQSLGLESIYPDIFEKTPIHDTDKLQVMLFAIQYSCAKCWIDCGVQVATVVGHSFGELAALCASGTHLD
jgi:acyl transferase domain-containing protein